MNLAMEAREALGLSTSTFALLLNVPESIVRVWESEYGQQSDGSWALLTLLKSAPRQCAEVLVEARANSRARQADMFDDSFLALIRKIHNCPDA